MYSIFLFSDSYNTKTFILSLDYLLDRNIKEIILLKENHIVNEFNNSKYKIILFDNLYDCINAADFIIIIQSNYLLTESINLIRKESKKRHVDCYILKNKISNCHINNKIVSEFSFEKYPTILCVSIGDFTQQIYIELILNKIFEKLEINTKQFFTEKTFDWIQQLKNYGLLSKSLEKQFLFDEYNIVISSINILNIEKLYDYLNLIKHISPDFLIIMTELNCDILAIENLKNIIKYNCNLPVDLIINSRYYFYNNKYHVYCSNKIKKSKLIYDIEYNKLECKIEEKILSKLAFPKGVVKLN